MIMTNNNSSANKPMSLAEVRERQRKRKLLKPNSATASIGSFAETTHIPRERLPSGTKENAIIADSTRAAESFSSSGKSLLPFKSVKTAAGLSVNQYRRTNWEWLSGTNQEQPEGYMAECTGGGGGGCSSEIDEDSDYEDGVENGVEYFGAATDSDVCGCNITLYYKPNADYRDRWMWMDSPQLGGVNMVWKSAKSLINRIG